MTYYYPMTGDDEIVRRVKDGQSYRKISKAMKIGYGILSGRICGLRLRGLLPQVNRSGLSYGQLLRDQRLAAEAATEKHLEVITIAEVPAEIQEGVAA